MRKQASAMMKDIIEVGNMGGSNSQLSKSNFKWKVNKGALTLFWEDIWEGERPLKDSFSRLYIISKWKEIEVNYFKDLWDVYDKVSLIFLDKSTEALGGGAYS